MVQFGVGSTLYLDLNSWIQTWINRGFESHLFVQWTFRWIQCFCFGPGRNPERFGPRGAARWNGPVRALVHSALREVQPACSFEFSRLRRFIRNRLAQASARALVRHAQAKTNVEVVSLVRVASNNDVAICLVQRKHRKATLSNVV